MTTLRLLYLLPADGFGGAERQGVHHLAELPLHGVDVAAFVGPSESLARELSAYHVERQALPSFPPATERGPLAMPRNLLRGTSALLSAADDIERRLKGWQPDLIFANRTFAWLVGARLSRRLGVPYAIRAGSRPAHDALGPAMSLLDRVARPAAVFYNCRAVKESIASRFDAPAYELPNVVDLERFAPASKEEQRHARADLGLALEAPIVGLAARPAPEKGFDFLAEIIARVVAREPRTRFAVAGDFGFRRAYEARFHALGLAQAVTFLGHVDVARFFRAVDVVVLTSRTRSIEASPNAFLEAMAAGRPIVATAVGGIPELVTHGEEGYLVHDGDAATFTHRLLGLLRVPELRRALGGQGRERAVQRHQPSTVVEQLARDLRRVASQHPRHDTQTPGVPCESITRSAPLSTFSFEGPPSRPSWSSPGAAT